MEKSGLHSIPFVGCTHHQSVKLSEETLVISNNSEAWAPNTVGVGPDPNKASL